MRGITSGLLVVCLGGGVASASPFVMMDRQDGESIAGGELMYSYVDHDGDYTLLRFDGHFQYVTPGGAGVYGTLPVAYADFEGDSVTVVGNIEVGGIFNIRANPETTVVLHGGVTLPTASDNFDDFVGGITASALRVHDLIAHWVPKGTTLRLAASPVYRSGNLFLRADVGLDLNIDAANNADIPTYMHINGAVGGFVSPQFVLSGEIISLTNIDGDDNTDSSDVDVAVTGRYYAGGVSPYFGVVIPTDSDARDDVPFAVVLGLDAKI